MQNYDIDELRRKSVIMALLAIVAPVIVVVANVWLFGIFMENEAGRKITVIVTAVCLFGFMIFLPAFAILSVIDRRRYARFKKELDIKGFFCEIESEHKSVLRSFRVISVAEKCLLICGYGCLLALLMGIWSIVIGMSWIFYWVAIIFLMIYWKCVKVVYKRNGIIAKYSQYNSYFAENLAAPLIKDRYGYEVVMDSENPPGFNEMLKKAGVFVGRHTSADSLIIGEIGSYRGCNEVKVLYSLHGDGIVIYVLTMLCNGDDGNSREYGIFSISNNNVSFEYKNFSFGLFNPQVQLFKLCKYLDKKQEEKIYHDN